MKSNQGYGEDSRTARQVRGIGGVLLLALGVMALASGCSKQAAKENHLAKANDYYGRAEYQQAEIEYLNVLRIQPTNSFALSRLGLLYNRQGNMSKGISALRKAYQADTNNLEVRMALAQSMLAFANYPYAITESLAVLARQPTNEAALLLLADASIGTNLLNQTRQKLEGILAQYPQSAPCLLALGSVFMRLGNVAEGQKATMQALLLNPKNPAAHAVLASLCLASNDLKGAELALKTAAELSPLHSARQLRYAEFKIRTGELEDGKRFLEALGKKAPDYLPNWIRLSEIDLTSGRMKEAQASIDKVLISDPGNYEAIVTSSRIKLAQREAAKAVDELEKLIKGYPRLPQAQYQLAVAHLANKDIAKAGAALEKALTLAPYYDDAELLRAELSAIKGDFAGAAAALNVLIKRRPEMLKAHQALIQAHLAQRDLEATLAACQQMAKTFPRNPQPVYQSGLLYRELNKPAQARAAFEAALAIEPSLYLASAQLVSLNVAEKKYDAALQGARALVQRHTNSALPRILLSGVQLAQGSTNLAEASLLEAISLEPTNMQPYLALVPIYMQTGRTNEALKKMDELVAKDATAAPAYVLKGMVYEEGRNYQQARDAYEKAVAIGPRFPPPLKRLAYLYSDQLNDLTKALDRATKAHEADASDPETADILGWIYFKQGKYPAAVSLLQESATRLSARPDVLYHLGMAQYMLGAELAARYAFQQALKSTNNFSNRPDAEKHLAFLNLDVSTATADTMAALEKHLQAQPSDPIALARIGALHEKNRAYDKAIETYERALKLNPNATAIMGRLALLHGETKGDKKKALELARNARNLAPDDANVAWLLGRFSLSGGDPQLALSLLQEASQKFPGQPEVQHDLALALYSNGKVKQAEDVMRSAVKAGPSFQRIESAQRFLSMSSLYTDPSRAQQAVQQIDAAIKADPDYLPALMASAALHEKAGNTAPARQTYERMVKISPVFGPAVRQLALLLAASPADEKQAYELCQRAVDLYPEDATLARAAGILASRRGDHARAVSTLQEVAAKAPGDPEVLFYLGKSQAAQRNKTEAAESLRQALSMNLKPPMLDEAKKLLETLK